VQNIYHLDYVRYQLKDCTFLGDKWNQSGTVQLNLFEPANTKLDISKSNSQKGFKSQFGRLKITGQRI